MKAKSAGFSFLQCIVLYNSAEIKRTIGINISVVGPECEQLSIVVEAERGRAVHQEAAVFEPVHHGNREPTDIAVHGDLCSHGSSDVVRALDDLQPPRDPCKVKCQHYKILPTSKKNL